MTTKIKYKFVNGDVLEVEADDGLAAYLLLDRRREANNDRKHRRKKLSSDAMNWEDMPFASQWGNPEEELLAHEEYVALSKALEQLTDVQKRRLILRLSGISCREIARQEEVSITSVVHTVEAIRKKLMDFLGRKPDE